MANLASNSQAVVCTQRHNLFQRDNYWNWFLNYLACALKRAPPGGGLHFCRRSSHALRCWSWSKPLAMEDWAYVGYIYLYGKQADSQQVLCASITFKNFSSIRSVYPGPCYKSCPDDSGVKVLWSGQAVPEQLLCVLIKWKGRVPLGA